jgi:nitrate reductase alpha subunit
VWEDTNAIKMHLIKRDFVKGYKTWSHHGEVESTFNNADIGTRYDEVGDEDADENDHVMMDDAFGCEDQTDAPQVDEECDVDMEEMLRHIEPEVLQGSAKGLENYETLKKAAKDRMYEGCGKEWTVSRFMLHLLIVKAKFGWANNSFNELLTLLSNLLPKPNLVPRNTYEA